MTGALITEAGRGTLGVAEARPAAPSGADLKSLVNEYERQLILSALGATRGHQRRAARCLGISPSSLHEKMKRLGIKVLPTWTAQGEVRQAAG
jgi:DNA-binding NtrC family response regulator